MWILHSLVQQISVEHLQGSWVSSHSSASNVYSSHHWPATLLVPGFLAVLVQGTKAKGTFSKRVRRKKSKEKQSKQTGGHVTRIICKPVCWRVLREATCSFQTCRRGSKSRGKEEQVAGRGKPKLPGAGPSTSWLVHLENSRGHAPGPWRGDEMGLSFFPSGFLLFPPRKLSAYNSISHSILSSCFIFVKMPSTAVPIREKAWVTVVLEKGK